MLIIIRAFSKLLLWTEKLEGVRNPPPVVDREPEFGRHGNRR